MLPISNVETAPFSKVFDIPVDDQHALSPQQEIDGKKSNGNLVINDFHPETQPQLSQCFGKVQHHNNQLKHSSRSTLNKDHEEADDDLVGGGVVSENSNTQNNMQAESVPQQKKNLISGQSTITLGADIFD